MKRNNMFMLAAIFLVVAVFLVLNGMRGEVAIVDTPDFTDISSAQLDAMMQNKDFTLINVHIPYDGEIENTDLSIPYTEISSLDLDKDAKIVLYCRSGSMSEVAAKELVARGYTNVYNLKNGMNEWKVHIRDLIRK